MVGDSGSYTNNRLQAGLQRLRTKQKVILPPQQPLGNSLMDACPALERAARTYNRGTQMAQYTSNNIRDRIVLYKEPGAIGSKLHKKKPVKVEVIRRNDGSTRVLARATLDHKAGQFSFDKSSLEWAKRRGIPIDVDEYIREGGRHSGVLTIHDNSSAYSQDSRSLFRNATGRDGIASDIVDMIQSACTDEVDGIFVQHYKPSPHKSITDSPLLAVINSSGALSRAYERVLSPDYDRPNAAREELEFMILKAGDSAAIENDLKIRNQLMLAAITDIILGYPGVSEALAGTGEVKTLFLKMGKLTNKKSEGFKKLTQFKSDHDDELRRPPELDGITGKFIKGTHILFDKLLRKGGRAIFVSNSPSSLLNSNKHFQTPEAEVMLREFERNVTSGPNYLVALAATMVQAKRSGLDLTRYHLAYFEDLALRTQESYCCFDMLNDPERRKVFRKRILDETDIQRDLLLVPAATELNEADSVQAVSYGGRSNNNNHPQTKGKRALDSKEASDDMLMLPNTAAHHVSPLLNKTKDASEKSSEKHDDSSRHLTQYGSDKWLTSDENIADKYSQRWIQGSLTNPKSESYTMYPYISTPSEFAARFSKVKCKIKLNPLYPERSMIKIHIDGDYLKPGLLLANIAFDLRNTRERIIKGLIKETENALKNAPSEDDRRRLRGFLDLLHEAENEPKKLFRISEENVKYQGETGYIVVTLNMEIFKDMSEDQRRMTLKSVLKDTGMEESGGGIKGMIEKFTGKEDDTPEIIKRLSKYIGKVAEHCDALSVDDVRCITEIKPLGERCDKIEFDEETNLPKIDFVPGLTFADFYQKVVEDIASTSKYKRILLNLQAMLDDAMLPRKEKDRIRKTLPTVARSEFLKELGEARGNNSYGLFMAIMRQEYMWKDDPMYAGLSQMAQAEYMRRAFERKGHGPFKPRIEFDEECSASEVSYIAQHKCKNGMTVGSIITKNNLERLRTRCDKPGTVTANYQHVANAKKCTLMSEVMEAFKGEMFIPQPLNMDIINKINQDKQLQREKKLLAALAMCEAGITNTTEDAAKLIDIHNTPVDYVQQIIGCAAIDLQNRLEDQAKVKLADLLRTQDANGARDTFVNMAKNDGYNLEALRQGHPMMDRCITALRENRDIKQSTGFIEQDTKKLFIPSAQDTAKLAEIYSKNDSAQGR